MSEGIEDISEKLGTVSYTDANGRPLSGLPHGFPIQEKNQSDSLNFIEHISKWEPNEVHVGLGGFYNLDVVATGAPYAIVFDINERQMHFWEKMLDIIKSSETRRECAINLSKQEVEFCRKNDKISFNDEAIGELGRESGWLSDDVRYARVRKAALENRIQPILLNILDTQRCREVVKYLETKGLKIGSLFLSNTPLLTLDDKGFYKERFTRDPVRALTESVRALCDTETQLIVSGLFPPGKGVIGEISYEPQLVRPSEMWNILRRLKGSQDQVQTV